MVAARAILKMRDIYGTEPADCLVALGPSIGPCCYLVGEDIVSQFRHAFGPAVCTARNTLDLKRAIKLQLTDVGVEESSISSEERCTACNLDIFYSYRAEGGSTGRMMSVIKLT
jgi:hypothetical protein